MRAHLAICSHGYLGLITSDAPVATPYSGDYQDTSWTGIHMANSRDKKIGDRWQSKNPRIICHMATPGGANVIERFNQDPRWGQFPDNFLEVNYFHTDVRENGDIWCEMLDGFTCYECTENGWSQTAGIGSVSDIGDLARAIQNLK